MYENATVSLIIWYNDYTLIIIKKTEAEVRLS